MELMDRPIFAILALLGGLWVISLSCIGAYHFGGWGAVAANLAVMFGLRITVQNPILGYFGASAVLGWPWWLSVAAAAPGVILFAAMLITPRRDIFGKWTWR